MEPNLVRCSVFFIQICVPKEYTDEEVITAAEKLNPSGTHRGWRIAKQGSEPLNGGDERCQCEKHKENVHVTLGV